MENSCDLPVKYDLLNQRFAAVCKERDELIKVVDQLVIKCGDETMKLEQAMKELEKLRKERTELRIVE